MGDGAAEGTGKGESGVEVDTAELGRSGSGGLLDDSIDLGRASGRHGGGHCDWIRMWDWKGRRQEDRGGIEWRWTWRKSMRQLLVLLVVVLVVIMEEKDSEVKTVTSKI